LLGAFADLADRCCLLLELVADDKGMDVWRSGQVPGVEEVLDVA